MPCNLSNAMQPLKCHATSLMSRNHSTIIMVWDYRDIILRWASSHTTYLLSSWSGTTGIEYSSRQAVTQPLYYHHGLGLQVGKNSRNLSTSCNLSNIIMQSFSCHSIFILSGNFPIVIMLFLYCHATSLLSSCNLSTVAQPL